MGRVSYSPELPDAAMKIWAQNNRPGWSEIARRVNEMFGKRVAPQTIKGWHDRGVPMNWEEFESRYKSHLYMNEAVRLAEESAEVREDTWVAMKSMMRKMSADMQQILDGELELRYRSADAFYTTYLRVITQYYKLFGENNEELIKGLLAKLPEDKLAELKKEAVPDVHAPVPEA